MRYMVIPMPAIKRQQPVHVVQAGIGMIEPALKVVGF
jgi:hypothetical protein